MVCRIVDYIAATGAMTARELVDWLQQYAEREAAKRPPGFLFVEPGEYWRAVLAIRAEAERRGWKVKWIPIRGGGMGKKGGARSLLGFTKGDQKKFLHVANDHSDGLYVEDIQRLREVLDEIVETS